MPRRGLLVAAFVIMPLLYFALVAGTGYGVYWHLSEHMPDLQAYEDSRRGRGRAIVWQWILYVAPAIAGSVLVLFLLKPLVAPRRRAGDAVVLERFQEPELHAFVDNVCGVIGAAAPKAIHIDCDINASAGFRAGLLSLFKRGDLVLTIGMPLAAGMSRRQLAGVLAHEFGHFAQGTGMRATYSDPFAGEDLETNLGESVVGSSPGWREIDQILEAGEGFIDRYPDMYRRTLAELVDVAERTERLITRAAKQRQAEAPRA